MSASKSPAQPSPGEPSPDGTLQKHACTACSKRKIKCDRHDPCSACVKSKTICTFQEPAPSMRHRKRPAEDELYGRLTKYEELLRAHNVDFKPYDNNWIPSSLQGKGNDSQNPSPSAPASVVGARQDGTKRSRIGDRSLWADLSSELQNPPQQRLSVRTYDESTPSTVSDTSPKTSSNEADLLLYTIPQDFDMSRQHPKPGHIFRLWQVFLDRVNPLLKIIHAPTLQMQVLEASVAPNEASKATQALMFAVYLLAVTSSSPSECESLYGETKSTMLARYRAATRVALVSADFISTQDLGVLQAFTLYLAADMDSPSAFVLSAVGLRIAVKMGIHREDVISKLSFFEEEMRTRLWWLMLFLDARVRHVVQGPTLNTEFSDLRLPLNVNDSDLHPNMVEPPREHAGPTEMLYPLLKYEVQAFRKRIHAEIPIKEPIKGPPQFEKDDRHTIIIKKSLEELDQLYEEKYLKHCDLQIPLHFISFTMAKLAICRLKFMIDHPRSRADGGAQMLPEDSDALFASSVRLNELENDSRKTKFAPQLLSHMTSRSQLDAFIYMISELRRRTSGVLVNTAWNLTDILFEEHPELITETENTFYVALGDLTLAAWEARQAELARMNPTTVETLTPPCVKALLAARHQKVQTERAVDEESKRVPLPNPVMQIGFLANKDPIPVDVMHANTMEVPTDVATPMLLGDDVDWAYWDQFLDAPTYGI